MESVQKLLGGGATVSNSHPFTDTNMHHSAVIKMFWLLRKASTNDHLI